MEGKVVQVNKEETDYPWIGIAVGGLICSIILTTTPSSSNYIMLNTIIFGTIFGCIYGWLIEESGKAIIIGGIVGGLFGLHPISFFSFVFGGVYIALYCRFGYEYKYFFSVQLLAQ